MPHSPEHLLQHLQNFIKHPNQIKQIHGLLITDGHLLCNPNHSSSKWIGTLLYNSLIQAYLNLRQPTKTLLLFTNMLAHQAPPNNLTFPSIVKAAASSPSTLALVGEPLHSQVIKRGVSRDPFIQTSFVCLYSQLGRLCGARKMFEEMPSPCIVAYNAMLCAFGKNGDMGSAVSLFERMPERDVVSWTTVINGFARNRLFGEAILFFRNMVVNLVKPNEATFVSVISSCASLDWGKQIHGYTIRNEIELTVFMGTALIDLYGKMGCLKNAVKVFNQMEIKEVCTWNAMISSLACNGREKHALNLFGKMTEKGLCPNEVTFVGILTACARAKLIDLGLGLFQSMLCEFGIVPIMEHYGCVVDLLGRAGLLWEATEIIKSMPFEPDASVLGALLGACKIHGAIELAEEVGRRLLELQPMHCGRYVVLSNINAGEERWGHAADIRNAMVEAGIKKIPAYSLMNCI